MPKPKYRISFTCQPFRKSTHGQSALEIEEMIKWLLRERGEFRLTEFLMEVVNPQGRETSVRDKTKDPRA